MSTSTTLPGAITVAESPAGLTYRFPLRRPHRKLLTPVLIHGAIGLALECAGAAIFLMSPTATAGLGVSFIVMGLVFQAGAVALCLTRSTVALQGGDLILTEWMGPIPMVRTRRPEHLRRFVTHRAVEGDDIWPPPNGVIEVVCEGAQDLHFAAGYPYEWLLALAADLAERCRVPHEEAPLDGSPAFKVRLFFLEPIRDDDTFDRLDAPADSRIGVERRPGGATVLRVPPGKLMDGWSGVFLFLIVALVPVSFFVGLLFLDWPEPVFLTLIVAGMTLPVAVWHFNSRHTRLVVTADALGVVEAGGLLRPRERTWSRAELAAIRIGPGSVGQRGRQTWELWIHQADGTSVGLFCGRDREELAWLATMLRHQLRLPAVAREQAAS